MTTVSIDCDTIAVASSAVCQLNCKVVHKKSGKAKHFSSKKNFLEEMAKQNKVVDENDFEFIKEPTLIEPNDGADIRWRAYKSAKDNIQSIVDETGADDYYIVIGKGKNYRHELATTWEYKGKRDDKPILTDDVKDFILNKYKDKAFLAEGVEAEDVVGWMGYEAYERARKAKDKDQCDVIMAHCDKDLLCVPGAHFNYFKPDEGVFWVDSYEAFKFFCYQLLCGDRAVDNIPGLITQTWYMQEFYGIRKGKTIGPKAAEHILTFGETPKEWWQIVVDCYKSAYPQEWVSYLQEQAELLWIQRRKHERIDVNEINKKYGVVESEEEEE